VLRRARPARPAPPPGARYTPAGRAASAELVAVHDMLRAELATVRDLIAAVQEGSDRRRAGQVRAEPDDHAAEQLDDGGLLPELLPDRDQD
jgi:hypothetical protein